MLVAMVLVLYLKFAEIPTESRMITDATIGAEISMSLLYIPDLNFKKLSTISIGENIVRKTSNFFVEILKKLRALTRNRRPQAGSQITKSFYNIIWRIGSV